MKARAQQLLFICSRNRIRSLTAEHLLRGVPGYRVASAGTQPSARVVVSSGLIRWADLIFCMEKAHTARLRARFPEELLGRQLITLHIPDEFEYMAEDLIDELRTRLAPHLTLPE